MVNMSNYAKVSNVFFGDFVKFDRFVAAESSTMILTPENVYLAEYVCVFVLYESDLFQPCCDRHSFLGEIVQKIVLEKRNRFNKFFVSLFTYFVQYVKRKSQRPFS